MLANISAVGPSAPSSGSTSGSVSSRFDRQRQILLALLPLSETERAAYLEKACAGDPRLRRDVESLLRVDPDRVLPSVVRTGGVIRSPERPDGPKPTHSVSAVEALPTRIGPFQVLGLLGRGGMGIVLRGRDTRLGREVALKILPRLFAGDPRLLARFRREAQLVAALNHPHIAQIYGLEESGATSALVMELVEGTTLAERLDAGPLELSQALGIARQIAEAIEAAHDRGIVHRDLKPANIMITTRGAVKILDFGVAAALGSEARGISNSAGPEEGPAPPGLSVQGLGTPAYMSPEQLRKRPVTRCADVWAFGCVCFEMLSGRSAFSKEKLSDTMAAVLTGGPDWSLLPMTTPPVIRRLVSRCLHRDESERLRDIGDVRILLDDIILDRTASAVARTSVGQPPRARWAVAATAILASLAAGFGVAGWGRATTPDPIREPGAISSRHENVLAAPSASVIPPPDSQSESHTVGPETTHSSPGSGSTNPSSPGVEAALHSAAPDPAPAAATLPPATPSPSLEAAAQRDAVARYFEEIERLEAQGKYWTDAQLLGRTVMDQALSGDAGGFDRLIAADEGVREAVARMNVPAPCSEHHSLTIDVLDQGLSLLRDVKAQALSEDGTSLETILSTGLGIEAKARAVDARAADIKRQFGIAR